jgi:hypothetical protein
MIKELEKQMDQLIKDEATDKVTLANKWKPKNLEKLNKQAMKKPEYVLVQYLRNNYMMEFQLCKVISGNIVVIDNKGHKLNPRRVWRSDKYLWYILRECDTEAVSNNDAPKLYKSQRSTDNHPILMKMVLGAIQKKEEIKMKMNLWWIIGIVGVGIVLWMIFGK